MILLAIVLALAGVALAMIGLRIQRDDTFVILELLAVALIVAAIVVGLETAR